MNQQVLQTLNTADPALGGIYQDACDHRIYLRLAMLSGLLTGTVVDVLAWLLYRQAADDRLMLLMLPFLLSGVFVMLTLRHRRKRAGKALRFCYRVCIHQQAEVMKTLISMGCADHEAVEELSDRNAALMRCIRLLERELEKRG